MNVCILMCRTYVAGSGVCGCVMIHPTSTFIPLLVVLYPVAGTIPLLLVLSHCWWYYPPVSFPW